MSGTGTLVLVATIAAQRMPSRFFSEARFSRRTCVSPNIRAAELWVASIVAAACVDCLISARSHRKKYPIPVSQTSSNSAPISTL